MKLTPGQIADAIFLQRLEESLQRVQDNFKSKRQAALTAQIPENTPKPAIRNIIEFRPARTISPVQGPKPLAPHLQHSDSLPDVEQSTIEEYRAHQKELDAELGPKGPTPEELLPHNRETSNIVSIDSRRL